MSINHCRFASYNGEHDREIYLHIMQYYIQCFLWYLLKNFPPKRLSPFMHLRFQYIDVYFLETKFYIYIYVKIVRSNKYKGPQQCGGSGYP